MINIILKGEPISTGSIYKSVCRGKFATVYMTTPGKKLKESYQWQARAQYRGQPIDSPVSVIMELFMGTRRKCDIDNFNKICFDSLTGIIWNDDSQIQQLIIKKSYDKESPRIELTIHSL